MFSPYRMVTERLTRMRGAGLLVLRVVVGWLFILHAIMKFQLGSAAFEATLLTPAHVPLAGLLAPVVPVIELLAGTLLVLGLFTRVAAVVLGVEMLFTGFLVKLAGFHTGVLGPHGVGGAELDFLYLAVFVLIVVAGPGELCLDALVRLESRRTDAGRE